MSGFKFDIKGLSETQAIFDQLREDIGDKNSQSKVLVPVVRDAMKPVLAMAQALVPKGDTEMLLHSLAIVGRRPTGKDKKSNYVNDNDAAIAIVTTKPIPRSLKKSAYEATKSIIDKKDRKKAIKGYYEEQGVFYDARAVAMEFGTKNVSPRPYLRVSLESQVQQVSDLLGKLLQQKIEQYRSRTV